MSAYIDHAFALSLTKNDLAKAFLAELLEETRQGRLSLYRPGIQPELRPFIIGGKSPLVCVEDRYYLRRCYELEASCLHHLKRLSSAPAKFTPPAANKGLYSAQQEALNSALTHPVLLISGGPGTGKTYLAHAIIDAVLKQNPNASILFTAPTGKAAFRIKHPGIAQGTLHNMLGIREKFVDVKPLIYDVILADESSMIDAKLFSLFLSSIPTGTHVILMGDPDQLPPVEAGHIFPDLFSLPLEQVTLNQCVRCDRPEILAAAQAIREGNVAKLLPLTIPLPKAPPIPLSESVTILTPFKQGPLGTVACNAYIEMHKNPKLQTPLMITKNDYRHNLMNGDTGWKDGQFGLFPEKIPLALLPEYDLAWTLSVHKSQGSEFDHVLILLPEGSEIFGKALLYTAVTRAKKSVTIAIARETLELLLQKPS